MNPPARRAAQLLTGFLAATVVGTTLLAPASHAEAQATSSAVCSAQAHERTAAQQQLHRATTKHRHALKARRVARTAYAADGTARQEQELQAARRHARKSWVARTKARHVLHVARRGYAACLANHASPPSSNPPVSVPPVSIPSPSVTVTDPRIAFYGSNFPIADITWSNIPLGQYQYFLRYDNGPVLQYPVTFVDVIPPQAPPDPDDDLPAPLTIYWQNGVSYAGYYLGPGCGYTPGQNVTVELWTSANGSSPAGVEVASATVHNPCA